MQFKDFHINIKIRIIEIFLARFVGGMIFPFMAIYLAAHFSAKTTGLLLMLNVLIGATTNIVGGYYGDLVGRKKILAIAEILRWLAFTTMALCNSPWFQFPLVTFFMMSVNSVCWGLAGPAGQAMLIDVSTPEQRKLMYSITYWATNFSIAGGGIIGGFFFKTHLFALFVALTIVEFMVMILIVFFIQESYVKPASHPNSTGPLKAHSPLSILGSYKKVIKDRLFLSFIIGNLLIFSMEMHLTNYIGIRLSDTMTTQRFLFWHIDGFNMVGILRTENTLLVVLTSILVVKWVSRFKDAKVLVWASLAFVVGYAVQTFSTNIWILMGVMLLATLGEVAKSPVEQTYMASLPPDDSRSSYMAFSGLVYNGSSLITSLFVTLSAFLSPIIMSIGITVVSLSGVMIYVALLPQLEKKRKQTDTSLQSVG